MELYFDRPRLREHRVTLLNSSRTDYMWIHDHDRNCLQPPLSHNNILFLYRDIAPTVFSNLMYDFFEAQGYYDVEAFCEEAVIRETLSYKQHLRKWFFNPPFRPKTIVKHENFVTHPLDEFKKIVAHFSVEWDEKKALNCFSAVTKEQLLLAEKVHKPALNAEMLQQGYKDAKVRFLEKWGRLIGVHSSDADLRPFFV